MQHKVRRGGQEVDQLYNFVEVEAWLWDNTQF